MNSKNRSRRFAIGPLAIAGALLALAPAAFAKTYKPDKLSDSPSHGLSLREAITNANLRPGFDKIVLEEGKTYKLSIPTGAGPPDENLNATGDLDIRESLKIQSSGKKLATVNAQRINRVFDVGPAFPGGVTAIFKRLKITGGSTVPIAPNSDGAGIQLGEGGSTDTLQLVNSVVSGNFSDDEGGGIFVELGTLSISKSTVRNNHADDTGGGIDDDGGKAFFLNGSTISDNTAGDDGGGIASSTAETMIITNSTISGNSSATSGGGIDGSADSISLSSVTVVRNRANSDNNGSGDGGGLLEDGTSSFVVMNSIVALNTVGAPGTDPDCSGTFTSLGVNLLTNPTGCTGLTGSPNIFTSDPKLGKLKDNGGPTKTIELKKHSPAINNAGSGSPKRDQRGEKRHNPDIGAFERT
jgi:hypothetical protein